MLRCLSITLILLSFAARSAHGQEPVLVAEKEGVVRVQAIGGLVKDGAAFVLTHGMGGLDQRFIELGRAIKKRRLGANVLIVDWTPGATKGIKGLPTPWTVAPHIEPTGAALAELLGTLSAAGSFTYAQATFIGESFGNYVNHEAARTLVARGHKKAGVALALNPASELGGYEPPALTKAFRKSASFHTQSLFDTQKKIADFHFELRTATKNAFEQHVSGILWLRSQIENGASGWLDLDGITAGGTIGVDGQLTMARVTNDG